MAESTTGEVGVEGGLPKPVVDEVEHCGAIGRHGRKSVSSISRETDWVQRNGSRDQVRFPPT